MNNFLFAYGTLQIPEILERIIGRQLQGQRAELLGFRRGKVVRADFPGIVPDTAAAVSGWVLGPLSGADLKLLDLYEGELYQRILVTVQIAPQQQVQCWVYAMNRWAQHRVSTEDWNIEDYTRDRKRVRLTYRN